MNIILHFITKIGDWRVFFFFFSYNLCFRHFTTARILSIALFYAHQKHASNRQFSDGWLSLFVSPLFHLKRNNYLPYGNNVSLIRRRGY